MKELETNDSGKRVGIKLTDRTETSYNTLRLEIYEMTESIEVIL